MCVPNAQLAVTNAPADQRPYRKRDQYHGKRDFQHRLDAKEAPAEILRHNVGDQPHQGPDQQGDDEPIGLRESR
jgi:hypothetical protein